MDAIPYACAQGLSPALVRQLVRVESSGNPYAIGVVGARLARQPRSAAEALATARNLERLGFNYSIGISQVNRIHFARLGWNQAPRTGFDGCSNLAAGVDILKTCFAGAVRAGYAGRVLDGLNQASRAALSCYYSGSFVTGERLGYVTKVLGTHSAYAGRSSWVASSLLFD